MSVSSPTARARYRPHLATVLLASAVAAFAALRGSWIAVEPEPGQYLQGFFEEGSGETVGLTLAEQQEDLFFPNMTFTARGELSLPPGTSAGIPLDSGRSYTIDSGGPDWAPYIVFGRTRSIGDQAVRLIAPQRLDFADGAPALLAWQATRSYAEDRASLLALAAHCAGRDRVEAVLLDVADREIRIRFGRCSVALPTPHTEPGDSWYAAPVAGGDWLRVQRLDGGFRANRETDAPLVSAWLLRAIVITALLALAFGLATVVLLSALLLASSFFLHPLLCVLLYLIAATLAVLALPVAIVNLVLAGRGLALRSVTIAVVYAAAVAAVASWWSLPSDPVAEQTTLAEAIDSAETLGPEPECVLAGYSGANDVQIRGQTRGIWRHLADNCERCRGGVLRYARSGQTFGAMREFACAPQAPLPRGGPMSFFGGTNDDFMVGPDYLTWAGRAGIAQAATAAYETVVRGLYYLGRPTGRRLQRLVNDSARRTSVAIDGQGAVIDDTLDCLSRRGVRLYYFHDFTIIDVAYGRNADRSAMLTARRQAVEAGGGRFVSLAEEFGAEAGVAWFNDFVHLSAFGHRRVAERICSEIAAGP